jgi:hypothetical protein
VAAAEVRDLYRSRYESARYWEDFTDFAHYRLEVEGVYYIGGFGVMGWVPATEYAAAAPDPFGERCTRYHPTYERRPQRRSAPYRGEGRRRSSRTRRR